MGFFNSESDVKKVIAALTRRERILNIETTRKIEDLINEAIRSDPRVGVGYKGFSGKYSSSGPLGMRKSYQLQLEYDQNLPKSIEDVIIDTPEWKLTDLVKGGKELPDKLYFVTSSVEGLVEKIRNGFEELVDSIFGLSNRSYFYYELTKGLFCVICDFKYCVESSIINMWKQSSLKKVIEIDRKYFGRAPKLIKAFLAFSYLQQTCRYNEEAADIISAASQDEIPEIDCPWVLHPYGPLCRSEGICQGISAAYQMFMNHFGIESHIIIGSQGEDHEDLSPHSWNMIRLDNTWLHVDATAGISGEGIYIGAFLKRDCDMEQTYFWNRDKYPKCSVPYPNYNAVENYIDGHYDELIDSGVEEKYMIPDTINE